jgi:hypothetical protein
MSRKFVITAERNPEILYDTVMAGTVKDYEFDFSPWAEDNAAVTAVTWTVKAGGGSVSGQALVANVASANVSLPDYGSSLIEITATAGALTCIQYLHIFAKDPKIPVGDYGLIGN